MVIWLISLSILWNISLLWLTNWDCFKWLCNLWFNLNIHHKNVSRLWLICSWDLDEVESAKQNGCLICFIGIHKGGVISQHAINKSKIIHWDAFTNNSNPFALTWCVRYGPDWPDYNNGVADDCVSMKLPVLLNKF